MTTETKEIILQKTKTIFAHEGYQGLSMRHLAKEVGVAQSVLYHYFPTKDDLLKEMFVETTKGLGIKRAQLKDMDDTYEMLRQRVEFQLDNAEDVVVIFKFYFHYREQFQGNESGYVPETAYQHILEVLQFGKKKGEIRDDIDLVSDAKVLTHAINGFVLEYYPHKFTKEEKEELIIRISDFLFRAVGKGGEGKE